MTASDRQIDHDQPATYPVYQWVERSAWPGGGEAIVGLKNTGLDLHFPDGRVVHYDLEGRLVRVSDEAVQWVRGLSGRTLELRRALAAGSPRFARRMLPQTEADSVVQAACDRVRQLRAGVGFASRPPVAAEVGDAGQLATEALAAAARFDAPAAHHDVAEFRAVYGDIPILPPDQYSSLVLLATEGCRFNRCTFCDFYRGVSHRVRSVDEFRQHAAAAIRYHGRSLTRRRSVFLGQANALLGTRSWRKEILRAVHELLEFPPGDATAARPTWWRGNVRRFDSISSFVDAFSTPGLTASDFAALHALHVRHLYVGMESGDRALLKWLRKPATPDQTLRTVRAAKAGGLRVGVIVLLGAGGEPFFDAHVRETTRLLRAMQLAKGDYIYLSPLVAGPESAYAQAASADQIPPLAPQRLVQQEQQIRAALGTPPLAGGPYVSRYDVENFLY